MTSDISCDQEDSLLNQLSWGQFTLSQIHYFPAVSLCCWLAQIKASFCVLSHTSCPRCKNMEESKQSGRRPGVLRKAFTTLLQESARRHSGCVSWLNTSGYGTATFQRISLGTRLWKTSPDLAGCTSCCRFLLHQGPLNTILTASVILSCEFLFYRPSLSPDSKSHEVSCGFVLV